MENEEVSIEISVYDALGKLVLTETNLNQTEVMLGKNIPVELYSVITKTASGNYTYPCWRPAQQAYFYVGKMIPTQKQK